MNRLLAAVRGPLFALLFSAAAGLAGPASAQGAPTPLLAAGQPVDWWFVYKFNASDFRTPANDPDRACPFGGKPQPYAFSQRYVVASAADPVIHDGPGLAGTGPGDPLGATFGEIWNGAYFFVLWNDQFYGDPAIGRSGCDAKQCGGPWGHSKGLLAWNAQGEGVVIQVTTPSWPGAASRDKPRRAGNTLGCVDTNNNVSNAQHFFALKLSSADVAQVLRALAVASVVTDTANPQVVRTALPGQTMPADLAALVAALPEKPSTDATPLDVTLSSGVRLVAKPSALNVPAWQFLSSTLGGVPLRSATWWASPQIYSTTAATPIACWSPSLGPAGAVDIAATGRWAGEELGLIGGQNHAKVGVSLDPTKPYAIFADLNQQGALTGPRCASSQNGRGGMFFVVENKNLAGSLSALLAGASEPQGPPPWKKPAGSP